MRLNELREVLLLKLAAGGVEFTDEQFNAVLGLPTSPGVVWQVEFGKWVLLQPEWVNVYAQALLHTLRADEEERGCIAEERALSGELSYPASPQGLPPRKRSSSCS